MTTGRGLLIWSCFLSGLLLLFTGAQLNPLGYLLAGILVPLPVLLTGRRLGDRAALLLALAGIAFILALKPEAATLWHNLGFLNLMLMGLLLSLLQHRGWSAPGAILLTVLGLTGLGLAVLLGQALYQGIGPLALMGQRGTEIMETVRQVLGEGAPAGAPLVPGFSQTEAETVLQRLLPGLVITNTGLVAWVNVVVARQLDFLRTGEPPRPPLYEWALPEWLIFGVLGAGFLLFVPVAGLRIVCLNLLLVLGVLYYCQGLAVVSAWFHRFGLPRFLRAICYPLLFLNPLCFLIVTLGVLDLWLDFRRLHRQPGDAGGGIES